MISTANIETALATETYGRFVIEPLDSGFGTTIGNALRRVLLGSLSGAAVTAIRIEGTQHEFSTIPHMKEDVTEFLLNVKGIRLRPLSDRPGRLVLDVEGQGEVTAADIMVPADYEILNPELHLATLDSPEARLYVELTVEQGRGYSPAEQNDNLPIGAIPVDAIFTPIRRVNYTIERTRVGQLTNYDRLTLEIWTDGTTTPQEAISRAADIIMGQLALFVDLGRPRARAMERLARSTLALSPDQYNTPIKTLGLSVRTLNCLQRAGIGKVGEILELSEDDLLAIKNFGRKSLDELRERLAMMGLWPTAEEPAAEPDLEADEEELEMAPTHYVAEPDDFEATDDDRGRRLDAASDRPAPGEGRY